MRNSLYSVRPTQKNSTSGRSNTRSMNDTSNPTNHAAEASVCSPGDGTRDGANMRALVWILVLGAIVRLAVWGIFAGDPIHVSDARDYDRLAVGLAETGQYLMPSGKPSSLRRPFIPGWSPLAINYLGCRTTTRFARPRRF